MKKHLDIGCGAHPKNPYKCEIVHGLDITPQPLSPFQVSVANLAIEPIPFNSNEFDSVSAFDFIEHIPRQTHSLSTAEFRFPFVELMNEIYRVLKPNGMFYALTPAFPSSLAFQDPTHVNIITDSTHRYFCGNSPLAKMYGFNGRFEVVRCEWAIPKDALESKNRTARELLRHLHRKLFRPSDISHLVWELSAVK